MPKRNLLLHGLRLTLRSLPALLWTYAFNLGLAVLFSIRLHSQLDTILAHSLHSQRLTGAFDIGTIVEVATRLGEGPSAGTASQYAAVPLYVLLYFLLVPGTLFSYRTGTPARLGTLLQTGLQYFWRFIRITLIAAFVSGIVLGILGALSSLWSSFLDTHSILGERGFLLGAAGTAVLFLVASMLRLYFDLVEVYTVALGQHLRPAFDAKALTPDRRVRRTLRPALRTLFDNFGRAWLSFLFLILLGAAGALLLGRVGLHSLAQPRVWPQFLLAQAALFLLLFTRFWQRGVETILAEDYPMLLPTALTPAPFVPLPTAATPPPAAPLFPHTLPRPATPLKSDPIPNPEPATPSLPTPDPGVFHHDPAPLDP
jgi:hypothetical protein